jgi:predicted ATP-grasp superfamily ATP-dependent carboligase
MKVAVLTEEERGDSLSLQVMYCLAMEGHKIHLINFGEERAQRYSRHCLSFNDFREIRNHEETLCENINDICDDKGIEIIVPTSFETVLFLSKNRMIIKTLSFPIPNHDSIIRLNDKGYFQDLLKSLAILSPNTITIRNMNDLKELDLSNLNFPTLVKPLTLSGSRGIKRFESQQDIHNYLHSKNIYACPPLQLQEFIEGEDGGLSFFARNGKLQSSVFMRKLPGGQLIFEHRKDAEEIGSKIVQATDYNGVGHIDFIVRSIDASLAPLELNPRPWLSISAAAWSGINFAEIAISSLKGKSSQGYRLPNAARFIAPRALPSFLPGLCFGNVKKTSLGPGTLAASWSVLSDPLPHFSYRLRGLRRRSYAVLTRALPSGLRARFESYAHADAGRAGGSAP